VADATDRPGDASGRAVSRRELDDVIRRAAELAAAESDSGEGSLDESELIRIAGEVGLSERHVRRALAEVRSGSVPRPDDDRGILSRVFGPERVSARRVVPGTPRVLTAQLDAFLVGGRLLQSVRKSDRLLQYRPAVDWASQVARVASATSRRYHVAAARSVEVRLEAVNAEHTLVEIDVDSGSREDAVGAAIAGAVTGVVAGAAAGGVVAFGWDQALPLALGISAGTLLTAGIATGSTLWARSRHRRKLGDVLAELEGVLDTLEAGETLEPPPPSWRKWVQRHFHGVAKDMLLTKDE
jgi:hypothetical protein